ncbi:hypothetical protein MTR_8g066107 [Medicago truncatula]|uniref:Uncharacterized protein n=1 Tax=Medicago truncatula TaxID=3880 RepID=A0A072TRM7_MEDTR|nr:hypothetical protein MTR_8g066107 [Medicago truncatula]
MHVEVESSTTAASSSHNEQWGNGNDTESPRHETSLHPLSDSIAENITTALRRTRRKRSEQSLVMKNEEEEPCYRNRSYLPMGLVRNFRSFKTEAWERAISYG